MKKKIIILNTIPFVFYFICFITDISATFDIASNVSYAEMIINTLVVPIYLVAVNYSKEQTILRNIAKFLIMAIIVLIGIGMIFLSWWLRQVIRVPIPVTVDSDTILITELQIWYGMINLTVSWIIANIIGKVKTLYQKHRKQDDD